DLGPGISDSTRDTYRFVGGARGDITDYLTYEVAGNYGRSENSTTAQNSVLYDRLFAAIDVVRGPNGQPICRSDISNRPHPGSETFPVIAPGFFSFRPGDGSCRPVNLFNGENSVSGEAVSFITTPTTTETVLEQSVATVIFTADSSPFFELPGGAVQLVFGGEYREEKSSTEFDPLVLGLLPENSPAGRPGTFIGDVSPNQSLIFDAQTRTFNTSGKFDVKELFGEISLPLLADLPFVQELTVGAAGRYADYSTVGSAFTWNVNGAWAPVDDLRFRGSYARAIRAPNIDELFSPAQGATFRPNDPCNASTRAGLRASGAANAANREANCLAAVRAAGIPNAEQFLANYEDPLTARFSGTSGGNPDLDKETADTWTVGTVIAPRWLEGLSISADYYSIEIEDAIAAVTAQDIVNTCYDIDTFPNQFCALFDRNTFNSGVPATQQSPTLFGFRFLRQTQLNFGRLETSGVDFTVAYTLPLFDGDLGMRVNGNWTEKLNRFFDPINRNLVNPGLHELSVPKWSGLGTLSYSWNGLTLDYSLQYIGKQAVASQIQIERIQSEFGEAGFADPYWVHGISASYDISDSIQIYGGVNNLTNEEPYRASSAYPVSGIGRFFFLGVETTF
ncbi:MAG: hypothetical protein RLY86_3615, partial [Pseudomonadota bacterium]